MYTAAVSTTEWVTLGAAAIGASAALVGAVLGVMNIGGKRRWDDELLTASSEFLVTVHQTERLSYELRGLPREQRVERLDELATLQRSAALHERRVALVGNHKVQTAARLARRHLYSVVQVEVHQNADPRPETGKTPRTRLDREVKALVLEVRRSLRVPESDLVFDPDE